MKRRNSNEKSEQAAKKQCAMSNDTVGPRDTRSSSSERTLQLLYQGATRQYRNAEDLKDAGSTSSICFFCHRQLLNKYCCCYCERCICQKCANYCGICQEIYCKNCSFSTYSPTENVCYTCYK